jgi:hypothetical protein
MPSDFVWKENCEKYFPDYKSSFYVLTLVDLALSSFKFKRIQYQTIFVNLFKRRHF